MEGIRCIGEAQLRRKALVESLIDTRLLEQGARQKREEWLIVLLDLNLNPPGLDASPIILDEKSLTEVLWVGNAAGSNSPQDRLTTDNPMYLASQTVPNLLRALPKESELTAKLRLIKDLYLDLGEKEEVFAEGGGDQQYARYRSVWDLPRLGIAEPELLLQTASQREKAGVEKLLKDHGPLTKEFLQAYAKERGSARATVEFVGKVLQKWIAQKLDVKSSQIKLYSLTLNGEILAQHPDYLAYLEKKLVAEAFEGPEAADGVCHVCGAHDQVTANTTRFEFLVFYNTDKPGFASGLRKRGKGGFLRNYTLCRECYRALLVGERFVENELRTRLGRSSVYVIPTFHFPEANPTAETLEEWAEYLKGRLAAAETLQGWHAFEQELERYQRFEEQKATFVLNLLFATKGQAAVKVNKLIANVPPSRFDVLDRVRNTVRDWATRYLGEDEHGEWDLSLGKLFYLLPLRQRDRQAETRPYLELLDALLVGRPVSVQALIPRLLETACIHRFERYDQYVHGRPGDPDLALVEFSLQSQLFLRYLKELGLLWDLKGGEITMTDVTELEREALDESLRAWMEGLGLDGARRGLFLLGVLVGRIGSTPEQRDSRKPILNKLHFQGMDRGKVLRLANEVYEKLRQYKIIEYNEALYAAMKAYLDCSLEHLSSPQENIYWVLSGYAYATWQAIRAGRQKHGASKADNGEEKRG